MFLTSFSYQKLLCCFLWTLPFQLQSEKEKSKGRKEKLSCYQPLTNFTECIKDVF